MSRFRGGSSCVYILENSPVSRYSVRVVSTFTVQTGEFEGPLELLLDLIERRKMHISDISLAQVADDYIEHINKIGELPMSDTAHFVLVASTLLLIKSKSLLPGLELTSEEEEDMKDLERRLSLYKRVRALSKGIEKNFGETILFPTLCAPEREKIFAPHKSITVKNIFSSANSLIASFPKAETLTKTIVDKVKSLDEMMGELSERIQKNLKMTFKEFSSTGKKGKEEKLNVVVSFLALLELVKQGAIAVQQSVTFSDIEISSEDVNLPNYS